jgi:hypothetical protein
MMIAVLVLIGLLDSCVSLEDKRMTPQERNEATIIGSVTATWTSTHFLHIVSKNNMKIRACAALKKVAQGT